MQHEIPDILATRLNFDVILFKGHTRSEMMVIAIIALTVAIGVLGSLSKLLLGMFMIGLGLSFPLAVPVGWLIANLLHKYKSGRPKGFVKQSLLIWLEKQTIKPSPFVRYSGKWSTRSVARRN